MEPPLTFTCKLPLAPAAAVVVWSALTCKVPAPRFNTVGDAADLKAACAAVRLGIVGNVDLRVAVERQQAGVEEVAGVGDGDLELRIHEGGGGAGRRRVHRDAAGGGRNGRDTVGRAGV